MLRALAILVTLASTALAAALPPPGATTLMPSGPVSEASLAPELGRGRPGPGWFNTATPDIQLHVDTVEDPDRPCVILTWKARDCFAGHAVERAESAAGPWTEIANLGRGVASTTDRRLERARRYHYRVVAVRGTLRSHPSTVVEVDLPSILAALEQKPVSGAPRRAPRGDQPADSDGTAFLMALILTRSFFKKRRA